MPYEEERAEKRYRALFDFSPFTIMTFSMSGFVTSCNAAMVDLSGYDPDDMVGKHFLKLDYLGKEAVRYGLDLLPRILRGEQPEPVEIPFTSRMGEACRYLKKAGMKNIEEWDLKLANRLLDGLSEIPGVEIYGPKDPKQRVGLATFNIEGMNPHDVALTLDMEYDVATRSGHHCALPLMKELYQLNQGNVRASTYLYNTVEEIDHLISAVEEIAKN